MSNERERRRRKSIRLDQSIYASPGQLIDVTLATAHRRRVFEHPGLAAECLQILRLTADNHTIRVIVYCFMPDHLHLFLENKGGNELSEFMRHYKSWTTRAAWRHGFDSALWQRSYYDHVVREFEDTAENIRYILANPVRAGIVDTWDQYRWSGSLVYDFSDPADWPS